MSQTRPTEDNMEQITEKEEEEDLSQEEVVAEMLNAPLGFLPFDLEAHYNSQSTTPESEKNGDEHFPGYKNPDVRKNKLRFAIKRKTPDEERGKKKEMRRVTKKLEKLREKQRKVEQKAAKAESKYHSLIDNQQDKSNFQDKNEAKSHGAKHFLHKLHHVIF